MCLLWYRVLDTLLTYLPSERGRSEATQQPHAPLDKDLNEDTPQQASIINIIQDLPNKPRTVTGATPAEGKKGAPNVVLAVPERRVLDMLLTYLPSDRGRSEATSTKTKSTNFPSFLYFTSTYILLVFV